MKPCLLASGVMKAKGWTMRCGLRPSLSNAAFMTRMQSREMKGSKWQLMPTMSAPAFAIRMAHSPAVTLCMSPSGPMHMEAATGRPLFFADSIAHSISSMCSKYWRKSGN